MELFTNIKRRPYKVKVIFLLRYKAIYCIFRLLKEKMVPLLHNILVFLQFTLKLFQMSDLNPLTIQNNPV